MPLLSCVCARTLACVRAYVWFRCMSHYTSRKVSLCVISTSPNSHGWILHPTPIKGSISHIYKYLPFHSIFTNHLISLKSARRYLGLFLSKYDVIELSQLFQEKVLYSCRNSCWGGAQKIYTNRDLTEIEMEIASGLLSSKF